MGRNSWLAAAQGAAALAAVAAGACACAWAAGRAWRRPRSVARAGDVTDLIGHTPVVRLNLLSRLTGCEVYGKLELANPGGSAKDRVALAIVEAAERAGRLRRGRRDRVYEGTSGSTGISLALVCCARGYEAHIVVPDDTSADKVGLLASLGAHVHKVRPAGIADSGHYVNVARRLAAEPQSGGARAIFADQFETEVNWRAHYAATGPELAQQLPELDAFVTGAGTGGTIAGVARYLKEQQRRGSGRRVRIVLADVPGSGLYNKVHYGVMYNATEREGHRRRHQVDTVVEGIGLNRVTANIAAAMPLIDDAQRVADEDARYMAALLVQHEGLFVGSTSAVNCVAALREARRLGSGHTVATILCDSGARHLSKFYAQRVADDCALAREIAELEKSL